MRPAVVGVGNRWRRDDGIGPWAVDALRPRVAALVDLLTVTGEATGVIQAWTARPEVWLIDAVRRGARPGTLHRIDGLDQIGSGAVIGPLTGGASTHSAGMAHAIALGRALDRLPTRLTVIGIEPADLGHGDQLSPPVAATFDELVEIVAGEVGRSSWVNPLGRPAAP